MPGRVLTIHLVEGTATGLQTAEIDNWIGKVFVALKTDLPMMLKQHEIKDALGVYVLIGDDINQFGKSIIYVGQGNVANRLITHSKDTDKDYWDNKTLAVVAKDGSLNTADCLYLESRLIELARTASSAEVKNQTNPSVPFLAATDKTRVENFLIQIQTLLPVLNINFFTPSPASSLSTSPNNHIAPVLPPALITIVPPNNPALVVAIPPSPQFVLAVSGIHAEAEIIDSKFVVLKGSTINPTLKASAGKLNSELRFELFDVGKLVVDPQTGMPTFTEDVAFTSPSAAAAVICGYSVAGPKYWKVKNTTQTYGGWLQSRINAVSAENKIT